MLSSSVSNLLKKGIWPSHSESEGCALTPRGGNPEFPAAAIRVPQHEHSAGSKFLDKAKETAAAVCPGPARCRVLAADRGGRAVGTAAVSAS